MRRLARTVLAVVFALLPTATFSGQIWTDGNGDGLPDQTTLFAAPSTYVTVDVWIDTQSYAFTYFQAWIRRPPCLSYVSCSYAISGGTLFQCDPSDLPPVLGGTGFPNRHGVILLGSFTYHVDVPVECCVRPAIDLNEAPYSLLGNNVAGTYQAFTSANGTCWQQPTATDPTIWGALKGIYR